MFLDPPYFAKGRDLYPESMKPNQHKELACLLRQRTNWIMSYDICPEITDLYSWAKKIEVEFRYSIDGFKKKDGNGWKKRGEYLIFPPGTDTRILDGLLHI